MNKQDISILYIEDNLADVRLIEEVLQENKDQIGVNSVRDETEAWDYLLRQGNYQNAAQPDLILLDLKLPGGDGFELLGRIKNHPDFKRIPVLILTGSGKQEEIIRAYELYANCFITKPGNLEQYIQVIKGIINFWFEIARLPS